MKKPLKDEIEMLELINKIQALLIVLDKKVDTLMHRSLSETRPLPTNPAEVTRLGARTNDHHKERVMHKAICADCKKECTIPFKPSADRPIYCQDCFSRRKIIKLSGIKVDDKPQETVSLPIPQVKANKKPFALKKTIVKKKKAAKRK